MPRYLVYNRITTKQWIDAETPEEAIAQVANDEDNINSGDLAPADSGIWVEDVKED